MVKEKITESKGEIKAKNESLMSELKDQKEILEGELVKLQEDSDQNWTELKSKIKDQIQKSGTTLDSVITEMKKFSMDDEG